MTTRKTTDTRGTEDGTGNLPGTGRASRSAGWILAKNGDARCMLTNGEPILDKAGNLKGYANRSRRAGLLLWRAPLPRQADHPCGVDRGDQDNSSPTLTLLVDECGDGAVRRGGKAGPPQTEHNQEGDLP